MEAKLALSEHRTCNTGKKGCISPTAHGRCDASRVPKGEGAMVKERDFNLVFGHNFQFNPGIYTEQMIVSNYKV